MQASLKNTRTWNIFALSILGLALAVFAWGLKYKLSLYEVPPSHHIVAAKLLSNRERPSDAVFEIERATTPVQAILAMAFGVFTCFNLDEKRQARWVLQRATRPSRRSILSFAPQVFFRPPPRAD